MREGGGPDVKAFATEQKGRTMSRNLMSSACDEETKKMAAYGDELHGKVLCDEERKKKRQKQWGGRKFTP